MQSRTRVHSSDGLSVGFVGLVLEHRNPGSSLLARMLFAFRRRGDDEVVKGTKRVVRQALDLDLVDVWRDT